MAVIILVVTGAWAGLAVRLTFLHLGPNETLKERVRRIRHYERELVAGRGRILDASGATLALDLDTKDIIVDPQRILENGQARAVARQLSASLGVPLNRVEARVNRPGRRYEYIQKYVQHDQFEQIERMKLAGVFMEDSSARYYPHDSMLCHVIGFANLASDGCAGIELKLDQELKGTPGRQVSEKDGLRREIYEKRSVQIAAETGCDVHLTVDINVQYVVEQALQKAVHEHNAKSAWAVVQEVKTGRILAMASLPAFSLNEYRSVHEDQLLNRVIGYSYEPGSTMKAAVIAAAFNEGIVTEDLMVDCEHGTWFYRGRPLRDFHPYGLLSVPDVLKKSSNIGTAKIALMLGEQRLESYLRWFGLGRRTGIELPGEETGVFHARKNWDSLTITRLPMGHAVSVTALQMVAMYSAIANDGKLLRPRIVDLVTNAGGEAIYRSEVEVVGTPIRPETSRIMRRLLKRVSEQGGTARRARIEGYDVAGKTGTAEKVINGRYAKHANIASFVGFLPANNPELCILTVVDEPHKFHTGGRVAAPIFKEIAEQIVRYLGIPPGGWEYPMYAESR
jgi:cell division protein FtsI (penicillin-binding protein 3)